MSINRQIILTFVALVLSIFIFGVNDIDIKIQDIFFDNSTQTWILDRNLEPYKFIFYDGIKKLLIFIAVMILIVSVIFRKTDTIQAYKKGIMVVILSAILVPAVVGGLKKVTNMPCPKNEIHYGGDYPPIKVWEHYSKKSKKCNKICCFPAGHASGGFALFSLFFLFKTRRNKKIALILALTVGWSMGIYKMLIGDHFFSHTVISMIIAWLIILLLEKFIHFKAKET